MQLRLYLFPLTLLLFILSAAPLHSTDLYRWVDERGVVHFSDNPHNIPKQFRENANRIKSIAPSPNPYIPPQYSERATIPLKKRGMTTVVEATLNDHTQVDFILDTGASYTVISSAVAEKININMEINHPKIRLQTANGIIDAPLVTLESIEISGMRVANLKVVVHDFSQDKSIAGLLGLNFLQHFRMNLDAANGILVLEKK